MANIPIRQPFMERRKDNLHIAKGPIADDNGTTPFPARSFVRLTAGVLVPCASAAVGVYGWCPDISQLSTAKPPDALYANRHWVMDCRDSQFIVNIASAGTVAGVLANVAIGTSYGIFRTAGATGIQTLDYTNTTQLFFTVVGIVSGQSAADVNPLVIVEINPAIIQA